MPKFFLLYSYFVLVDHDAKKTFFFTIFALHFNLFYEIGIVAILLLEKYVDLIKKSKIPPKY